MRKKITFGIASLIVTLIIYSLVSQIINTVRSGDRLGLAADNLILLQNQNKELNKRLSEVTNPKFIEEQARNKLGFAKKGETLVIIPDEKIKQVLGASQSAKEARLPNWLGWWKVFFP